MSLSSNLRGFELADSQLKQLLKDLEASNLGRDAVDINKVITGTGKEKFYGEPGSARNTAFRRKFYQLRRNSLSNYRKCTLTERR